MTEPIKPRPNDKPLSRTEALAGAEITSTDIARARAKWRRRVPGFEARIKKAAEGRGSREDAGAN